MAAHRARVAWMAPTYPDRWAARSGTVAAQCHQLGSARTRGSRTVRLMTHLATVRALRPAVAARAAPPIGRATPGSGKLTCGKPVVDLWSTPGEVPDGFDAPAPDRGGGPPVLPGRVPGRRPGPGAGRRGDQQDGLLQAFRVQGGPGPGSPGAEEPVAAGYVPGDGP